MHARKREKERRELVKRTNGYVRRKGRKRKGQRKDGKEGDVGIRKEGVRVGEEGK